MKVILIAAALSAAMVVPATADPGQGQGKGKAKGQTPAVIEPPQNFQPEGIATGKRHTFFVGSRTTGAIYRGSLRTGQGDILVEGGPDVAGDDRAATGPKVDRYGRLFASGPTPSTSASDDAQTGDELRDYFVGDDAGFINDVIVAKRGAYSTDSNNAWLYFISFGRQGSLGELTRIRLVATTRSVPG